jgi:hypothetical protein
MCSVLFRLLADGEADVVKCSNGIDRTALMDDEPTLAERPEPTWRRLFPEIDSWIEGAPEQHLDGGSLALGMARADAALALSEFCWPSFVVIDDMVFRAYSDDHMKAEAVSHLLEVTKGDKTATERVLTMSTFAIFFNRHRRRSKPRCIGARSCAKCGSQSLLGTSRIGGLRSNCTPVPASSF